MGDKRRILILSLGTGKLSDDSTAGYKETQYSIEGKPYNKNGEPKKTNFVAEPIIDFFKPDIIIILGTIKSVWHQLYATITTRDNDDDSYLCDRNYKRLFDIERDEDNGIKTSSDELNDYSEEIAGIFNGIEGSKWEKYSDYYKDKAPRVIIMLTKYGVNKSELKENYNTIKGIESCLEQSGTYEVAFDITHSFRSLPIYNLIILNYISNITKFDISIKHIYYGNIDASHEMGGTAPIVDLADLVDILNLTGAVTEFKNTGNTVSLLDTIDNDDRIKKELEEFDLVTQLNAFGSIKNTLTKLCETIKIEASDNVYTGLREMIGIVFNDRFFEDDTLANHISTINETDLKFLLTKWFFNQNRMGLGLATGLEALRDINTDAFVASMKQPAKDLRQYRENAEKFFMDIGQRLEDKNDRNDLENVVYSLGNNLGRYKKIRNMFAHSLAYDAESSPFEIREEIERFKSDLFLLKKHYDLDAGKYNELFRREKNTVRKKEDACRVIIDFGEKHNYLKYANTINSKYDVLYIDEAVAINKILKKANETNAYKELFYLCLYLKENIPSDYSRVQIIVAGDVDNTIESVFRIYLENFFGEDTRISFWRDTGKDIKQYKKLKIRISMDKQKELCGDSGAEYDMAMKAPLASAVQNYER